MYCFWKDSLSYNFYNNLFWVWVSSRKINTNTNKSSNWYVHKSRHSDEGNIRSYLETFYNLDTQVYRASHCETFFEIYVSLQINLKIQFAYSLSLPTFNIGIISLLSKTSSLENSVFFFFGKSGHRVIVRKPDEKCIPHIRLTICDRAHLKKYW